MLHGRRPLGTGTQARDLIDRCFVSMATGSQYEVDRASGLAALSRAASDVLGRPRVASVPVPATLLRAAAAALMLGAGGLAAIVGTGPVAVTPGVVIVSAMFLFADLLAVGVSDGLALGFAEIMLLTGVVVLPVHQMALAALMVLSLRVLVMSDGRNGSWQEFLVSSGSLALTLLALVGAASGASALASDASTMGVVLVVLAAYVGTQIAACVVLVADRATGQGARVALTHAVRRVLRQIPVSLVVQVPIAILASLAWQTNSLAVLVLLVPICSTSVVAKRAQRLKDAERRAETDPLTGLANRAKFFLRVDSEIEIARRFNHPLALIMGDLDNFKRVNDTRGHLAGDHVLRATANAFQRVVDEAVFPLARYGGEEFIIALPAANRDLVGETAELVRATIEKALEEWGTSISLGVAYLEAGDRMESLIDRADKALYSAKLAGKNRVHECSKAGEIPGPVPVDGADVGPPRRGAA